MLPDDFENLCESIVATIFFSNNILAAITTKNYWDIVNEYKPLMHTWYLGILMEFYFIYPFVFIIAEKLFHGALQKRKAIITLLTTFTILSVILYLLPLFSDSDKFYFLPFRCYEMLIGGLLIFFDSDIEIRTDRKKVVFPLVFLCLLFMIIFRVVFISDAIRLLFVVLSSAFLLFMSDKNIGMIVRVVTSPLFIFIGKRSFGFFIWHQILIAFCRYYFTNQFSIGIILGILGVSCMLADLSYRLIERNWKTSKWTVGAVSVLAMIICAMSGVIYLRSGVVRDVPELDISVDHVSRNMHAKYNHRIYAYNLDFPHNGKINVLVIGNSFARDWANILLESDMAEQINLSYSFGLNEDITERIQACHYIFIFSHCEDIPQDFYENINPATEIWGIGTKNFGQSNGIIYKNRKRPDYFAQTAFVDEAVEAENRKLASEWGERYIDLLSLVRNEDGSVKVFSDDHKFISQDCSHLTKGGAKYFARLVNFEIIFSDV